MSRSGDGGSDNSGKFSSSAINIAKKEKETSGSSSANNNSSLSAGSLSADMKEKKSLEARKFLEEHSSPAFLADDDTGVVGDELDMDRLDLSVGSDLEYSDDEFGGVFHFDERGKGREKDEEEKEGLDLKPSTMSSSSTAHSVKGDKDKPKSK